MLNLEGVWQIFSDKNVTKLNESRKWKYENICQTRSRLFSIFPYYQRGTVYVPVIVNVYHDLRFRSFHPTLLDPSFKFLLPNTIFMWFTFKNFPIWHRRTYTIPNVSELSCCFNKNEIRYKNTEFFRYLKSRHFSIKVFPNSIKL